MFRKSFLFVLGISGLTKDEIQIAVQRAGVTDDTSSLQTAQLPQPQLQHPATFANTGLVPAQQFLPCELSVGRHGG